MDYVSLVIGILVGGGLGFLIAKVMKSGSSELEAKPVIDDGGLEELKQENKALINTRNALDKSNGVLEGKIQTQEDEIVQLNMQMQTERDKNEKLIGENSGWSARYIALEEKLATQKKELEEIQNKFKTEFENIANKILEQKSEKFTAKNKENLEGILGPLKDRIQTFEEKVEKSYSEENNERINLKAEIHQLMNLNKQLSEDANNLANALKGENKTQGDWGEMQLEMILEQAGLRRNTHYVTQTSYRNEEGKLLRPDFIINLPDDKHLILDSKVSLTAYSAFFTAESDEERALHLKAHLNSIRNHVRDLGEKNYQNLYEINSPDYVLMFIPIESAFTIAFQNDDDLFLTALKKNIVIVTTSTLLATMRTVSFIWKQEDQKRNVLEIARQGALMYDKFVGFVEDLEEIGKRLNKAKEAHDGAMNKLTSGRGNLVKKAEDIKKLGLKTNKAISQQIVDQAEEEIPAMLPEEKSSSKEKTESKSISPDA